MGAQSGYEDGSEKPPFTSDITLYDSALKPTKKPCEVCGSVANELFIMTCFKCTETREHTYCARVILQRVPRIWLCEECRTSSSIAEIADKTANSQVEEALESVEAAQSLRTNQVVYNQDSIDQIAPSRSKVVDHNQPAPLTRTNQVVDNKDSIEVAPSSTTYQIEQVVPFVPRIHHYTTKQSSLEPSCPVSPCSVYKPVWERFPPKRPQYIDVSIDSECKK